MIIIDDIYQRLSMGKLEYNVIDSYWKIYTTHSIDTNLLMASDYLLTNIYNEIDG